MVGKGKKPISHLQFRSRLANELISNYFGRKRIGTPVVMNENKLKKVDGRAVSVETCRRTTNVGAHIPIQGPKYRRCAFCSTKNQIDRGEANKAPKRHGEREELILHNVFRWQLLLCSIYLVEEEPVVISPPE
ncbi:hypothetical protein JTB14_026562 [Gonioctena quinquepunctata]|nr:hypothetical protein JTB14_026562 [Gonioctena quinquepunctata]